MALVATLAVAASVGCTSGRVAAQAAPRSVAAGSARFSYTPQQGRPGTTISLTGVGCPRSGEPGSPSAFRVYITFEPYGPQPSRSTTTTLAGVSYDFGGVGGPGEANTRAVPRSDHTWTARLVVPNRAPRAVVAQLNVTCARTDPLNHLGTYGFTTQSFRVL
jgi:hypothetical protein